MINPKMPLSRVSRGSRYNLSLPLPIVKSQSFDNADYLSPQPPPSVDYDEIPYAITTQNAGYLELAPEPSNQPPSVPFEYPRPANEYLQSADLDVLTKPKVYEPLISREK